MTQDQESVSEEDGRYHRPVLAGAVSELMAPVPTGVVVDATYGGGGHARELAQELGSGYRILGIDRDPEAVARAAEVRRTEAVHIEVRQGNFADLGEILTSAGVDAPVGVLFDFGVSSHHFDEAARGFSYRLEGPLDMRMDPGTAVTAADLVNGLPEPELASLLRQLGEEPAARRIAAAIVAHRPLHTTTELASVIENVTRPERRRLHPARRTFQALRMAVNDELGAIASGVSQALDLLAQRGRCITIAYHSLEDRLVKNLFRDASNGCVCPPEMPVCGCGAKPRYRPLIRGARKAGEAEIAANPRARSARLRAVERVAA
jgi:16S rRNA (cytosine1402-N4)-methyltransferase